MEEHLKGLNKEQTEAAMHMAGPLLIVAGAGAGKTKTITHRIVNLIKNGVPPEKILAVTFTNKAAKEMRERIIAAISAFDSRNAGKNIHERTLGSRDGDGQRKFSAGNFRGESGNFFSEVPFVSTFHSLGVYIIKENARLLGLTKYFTILDESDATGMVKEIMKEIDIDPKQYDPKKIKNIISREKGKFIYLEEYAEKALSFGEGWEGSISRIVAPVWGLYEKRKMKENALDFDDLLLKATKLLKDNLAVRQMYQEKWEYIHVDEYQDTNEVQYMMCKLLAEAHKNICVVGDADQNIYSWRGANLKNILSFEKDYPNATIILLEQNYRSTKNILEAANTVIKKNQYRPDKNLFTDNEVGEKIGLYEALHETDEADFVATKILEITDGGKNIKFESGLAGDWGPGEPRTRANFDIFSSVAVLYRANFQSRALEEAMLRYNIPYQVLGVKFFERKEIKDTLAYLRAALNPESLSDIKRIINFPARGIGKVTLVKIFAGQVETLPAKVRVKINNFYRILEEIKEKIEHEKASAVIKFVVKHSGIEAELSAGTEEDLERLENIKELATLALKYDNLQNGQGIEKLLEDASLASDQDSLMLDTPHPGPLLEPPYSPLSRGNNLPPLTRGGQEGLERGNNAVKLMTVHAAKGLEFKYVFVTGLEDGLFPHERRDDSPASAGGYGPLRHSESAASEAQEEERRLFYVALTRAKEKLFLSFANFRTIFGSRNVNAPSEFIGDIPANLLEKEGEQGGIKTIYI